MYQSEQRLNMKRTLNGMIHGVFNSEAECAKKLGWDRQRLNRIVNGQKEPSLSEAAAISAALGRSHVEVADIFLAYWSPNRQQAG